MIRIAAMGLMLAACAPAFPEYDPGGSPDLAMARIALADAQHVEVAVRGVCFSSCALKLSATRLCVSPTAQIGVHEVRHTPDGDYQRGTRDELRTAFFAGMLPPCVRAVFSGMGGFQSGRLVTASGREIMTACPEIKSC